MTGWVILAAPTEGGSAATEADEEDQSFPDRLTWHQQDTVW